MYLYFLIYYNFCYKNFLLYFNLKNKEADNDVDTDDEQLELAKDHVHKVLKNTIKNFNASRDLNRRMIPN
jgi:hypothetical protein